ncbi:hybrid-cluster NAD(P)-dependent oxidoreductase [Aeromonas simiae]|uniref:hybrid-cluster NAD(P)-dependent oxidoreductase n=1 Tax=Aeromonas simiae TaxID=218936 RepID=UPI0005A9E228|nr:hybrid-cluster NAD(P)-dependent oxidoreductase [Aeromonas simiae]
MTTLVSLHLYPVKSCAALSPLRATVTEEGLLGDRRYMVVRPDGSFITARTHPRLLQVLADPFVGGVRLAFSGSDPLRLEERNFTRDSLATRVWQDDFEALTTTDEADAWISRVLGEPARLLWLGKRSNRYREKTGTRVSFADGYPLLLISEASLEDLNRRSDALHLMSQFRPNLVVSGTAPFAEDGWARIRIGEVEFTVAKPCSRCIMTTVEPGSERFNPLKEPLATLTRYRRGEDGEVYFGQNLIALNEGTISAGDPVEVLETRRAPAYPNGAPARRRLRCVARETLARELETFWLEADDDLPLPDYLPGQYLPIAIDVDGQRILRNYTLSSSPSRPERLAITVKRLEGGRLSTWLHQQLGVGKTLLAHAPAGEFHLGGRRKLLLLSAGSGITPMLSMARFLADQGALGEVHFLHQCRSEVDIPAREELLALRLAGMQLQLVLSRPDPHWQGLRGHLTLAMLEAIPELAERDVYLCGPTGFMQLALDWLAELGVPAGQLHHESFGGQLLTVARPHQAVRIRIGAEEFIGNNQGTLLDQAAKQGIDLPWSCRAGICGSCRCTLRAGEVDQPAAPALDEAARDRGEILACCAVPLTDVHIE